MSKTDDYHDADGDPISFVWPPTHKILMFVLHGILAILNIVFCFAYSSLEREQIYYDSDIKPSTIFWIERFRTLLYILAGRYVGSLYPIGGDVFFILVMFVFMI